MHNRVLECTDTPIEELSKNILKHAALGAASSLAEDKITRALIKRRRKQARMARRVKKNPKELPKSKNNRRRNGR